MLWLTELSRKSCLFCFLIDVVDERQHIPPTQELAERAQLENEGLNLQDAHDQENAQGGGSKKDKKKKLKSENKGNFSSYRNKSFIPGASRTGGSATAKVKNNLELLQEMVGGGSEESGEEEG